VPAVGLATTELSTVIDNGVNGFIDTDPARLVAVMRRLLDEPETARRWGEAARRTALARFGIGRFVDDWNRLFAGCVGRRREAA
jgi:glycosyltransferase involved in cell wall biosynthesis